MDTKEAVRLACKTKRAALRAEDCEQWTIALTREIVKLSQYKKAQKIMLYLAMPREANLDAVITQALQDGKDVYVPVCTDKTTMIAVRLHSLSDVTTGVLHIRIPNEPYDIINPSELDHVLVPGVGFDYRGGRMGMGNGYYDRFLSILRPEQFIGVCWNMQILSQEIPMEDYDVRMTQLITETGLLQCQ